MRVLHVLSQRPGRTGSGVTLEALVREAAAAGHQQRVLLGSSAEDPAPEVGDLPPEHVMPLLFGEGSLDFLLPGMSDVMPYASSCFSCLDVGLLDAYKQAWKQRLESVLAEFQPDIVHSHHLWLLSSWLKEWLPQGTPVLTHCHATGFRQMELCPHLAPAVLRGCARNEAFCVLHAGHAQALSQRLGVEPKRIHQVGAGYRKDLFHKRGRSGQATGRMLFVGKLSHAKGLTCLLDAFATMPESVVRELWVVGSGGAEESKALEARMQAMPRVRLLGMLDQATLAERMRQVDLLVLPSFFEGLPLVLVEGYACGCRLVATDLDGIRRELAPRLGEVLHLVAEPAMRGVDVPEPSALPDFTRRLGQCCEAALLRGPVHQPDEQVLAAFTWRTVFARVEAIWRRFSGA
ncbi:MAG: glycosyltransferase family 4 protein [Deltaproteobacteria bacterium]|nr:glycosyltransferase family 4 protein [Deltaproteobacteria bacterium]